mgnify:CR=1 FL=1
MVQKVTEGLLAKFFIMFCEQDKFMPGIVNHLGRHRHHFAFGLVAKLKIVAQALKD